MKQVKGIIGKIKDIEERLDKLPTVEVIQKIVIQMLEKNISNQDSREKYDSKIVRSDKEVIRLSNQGYDCQMIGSGKWLMRKKLLGQMPS